MDLANTVLKVIKKMKKSAANSDKDLPSWRET
jgi:hypothetical protein